MNATPVFARESAHEVLDELTPLTRAHYAEVTHHADIAPDFDVEKYLTIERAGILRIYTVRQTGALVGYGIYTVAHSLHYRSSLQARQDTLYLAPTQRCGLTGYKFLRWIDAQLQAEGVQIVYNHGKFIKDIRSVFQRLGYEPVYYVYGKRLSR